MEAEEIAHDWKNHEIKEEILSDDEISTDLIASEGSSSNGTNILHSDGVYSCFIKEETSKFDFKEEIDDEPRNFSLHDTNDFLVGSENVESDEHQNMSQIVVKKEPILLDENNQTHENVEQKSVRKKYRKKAVTSLFLHSVNDDEEITLKDSTYQKNKQFKKISPVSGQTTRAQFPCSTCKRNFKSSVALQVHKSYKCCSKRSLECAVCGYTFAKKGNLIIHLQKHTSSPRFTCTICYESFSSRNELIRHKKQHTGRKSHKCDICGMIFSEKNYLTCHMIRHSTDRPFSCDICNMTFKSKSVMKNHMLVHLDDEFKIKYSFDCKICSKSFLRKNHLQAHVRSHAYEQFSFSLCKK